MDTKELIKELDDKFGNPLGPKTSGLIILAIERLSKLEDEKEYWKEMFEKAMKAQEK